MSTIHKIMVHFHNWFDLFVNIIQFETTSNRFVEYDYKLTRKSEHAENLIDDPGSSKFSSYGIRCFSCCLCIECSNCY